MRMLEAMRDTVALMNDRFEGSDSVQDSLSPAHIRDMLATMESGVNPQDTEAGFSEGKMGRWLGWAQAAVVAMGCATLEDMKNINKRWAEPDKQIYALLSQEEAFQRAVKAGIFNGLVSKEP